MKKLSKEQPTSKTNTPFEIETKTSKEEIDSGKLDIKELEALMAALFLLANNKNIDGGVLDIKIDPITKKERATVYQNSDHKPIFMTEEELEIHYLRDPEGSLKALVVELQKRQATNKVIKDIQNDSVQTDQKN